MDRRDDPSKSLEGTRPSQTSEPGVVASGGAGTRRDISMRGLVIGIVAAGIAAFTMETSEVPARSQ